MMTDHQPLTAAEEAEIRHRGCQDPDEELRLFATIDAERAGKDFAHSLHTGLLEKHGRYIAATAVEREQLAAERARAEKAEGERDTEMVLRAKAELELDAALETNEAVKREHLPKLVSIARERDALRANRDRLAGALREIVGFCELHPSAFGMQVLQATARAALADTPAPASSASQIDAAAEYLARTAFNLGWSGLRADGRAADRGFRPWNVVCAPNAHQEDYSDLVRDVLRIAAEAAQRGADK
jgi:hypothetical protein